MTKTSENPHEPTSSNTQPEAPAPQPPSADHAPLPQPAEGFRIRIMVNGS
jgi:hypothetical protein